MEGYLGNNKLCLMVLPEYAEKALELYRELDPVKYYRVALADTKRLLKDAPSVMKGSLAEEIDSAENYIRAYVDYLTGTVMKCGAPKQLGEYRRGITPDCILYQGYRLQHINPRNYTEEAYIGRSAVEKRLRLLEQGRIKLESEKEPIELQYKKIETLLELEFLSDALPVYEDMLLDIGKIRAVQQQKEEYQERIEELKQRKVDEWEAKKSLLEQEIEAKSRLREQAGISLHTKKAAVKEADESILRFNEELLQLQHSCQKALESEEAFRIFIGQQEKRKPEELHAGLLAVKQETERKREEEYHALLKQREQYHAVYAYRGFSLTARDNREYDELLEHLSSDRLAEFMNRANEQAAQAVYHFKTDFIYKIRDAIKEVMQQKEELNHILGKLDFGKDRYKFIITKNWGEDGKFYDMFMDENLEINPQQLTGNANNQMDLFSMQHEKDYSELINELIELFMPPENCDSKQLEEARSNMEKYADYRTYLSFDMEQIIDGMPPMRLSRMLSKNSGGEGQNPLYVALLASFAQIYRIDFKSGIQRRPTPRLVILDEAFSKMDAEKVGSCIGLIRKLGFQAIISATNDKIQNYVDNVDKTFVFANPNKNRISVQEFQKRDFSELLGTQEEAGPVAE